VLLAWVGGIAHIAGPLGEGTSQDALARTAHRAFVLAAVLAAAAAALGTVVAAYRTF
jgi:hypothetical protein